MTIEETKVDNFRLDELKACPWCGVQPVGGVCPNICKVKLKIFCPKCKIGVESVIDEPISFGTMIFKMKELNDKWNERA